MTERNRFLPEERDDEFESYDVAPLDMPPAPAGANAEIGGESAASRRVAGVPSGQANDPENRVGEPTPGAEPILGYDGLGTDDVIAWIKAADPETPDLRRILEYETRHRNRDSIVELLSERLRKLGGDVEN